MNSLLLGCGNNRERKMSIRGDFDEPWGTLVTIDFDPNCGADYMHDLRDFPYPFASDEFDEVHAYDVLEHLGQQGDYEQFFALFTELHRILKPGGVLCALVPRWDGVWAWGDPGHTWIINEGTVTFLTQANYSEVGDSARTDYRHVYKADFDVLLSDKTADHYAFALPGGEVMPLYKFECNMCGAQESDTMTFAEHDDYRIKYPNGRPHDWHCKGELKQVMEFHLNLGMREHYSTQLEMNVSSDRQFNAELRRRSEEYTERTGLEMKLETIDPSDMKAAGATEKGLEETARLKHNAAADGHKKVFT